MCFSCGTVVYFVQTVRVLLQHGGNPHHANEKGLTPIDVCTHPDILDLLKSHNEGHTHKESKSSNKDNEENPCPSRNHSSSHDSVDVTDKEELSPVFSPESTPVTMATPTQAMTTPIQVPSIQLKKTRLRDVSFSDISSSESDLEPIGDSKECEKDGPITTVSEDLKVDTALPVERAKNEKDEWHLTVNGEEKSSDSDNENIVKESSPELDRDRDTNSPLERNQDLILSPSAQGHASVSSEHEEATPHLVAPGHVSRVGMESEGEQMLLSIPLSAVKVSSSRETREKTSSVETRGESTYSWEVLWGESVRIFANHESTVFVTFACGNHVYIIH